jgi:hypothetical protein
MMEITQRALSIYHRQTLLLIIMGLARQKKVKKQPAAKNQIKWIVDSQLAHLMYPMLWARLHHQIS